METSQHTAHTKNLRPALHADFRPIGLSITPVLTRVMERTVVKRFLYPAFMSPSPHWHHSTSLPSALQQFPNDCNYQSPQHHHQHALILTNPLVIVIALDFRKAFDTVRHTIGEAGPTRYSLPDYAYNWLAAFFSGHSHCTVYQGQTSMFKDITLTAGHNTRVGHRVSGIRGQWLQPISGRWSKATS